MHRDGLLRRRRHVHAAEAPEGRPPRGGPDPGLVHADVPRLEARPRPQGAAQGPQDPERLHDGGWPVQARGLWRVQGAQRHHPARSDRGGHAVLPLAGNLREQVVR